VNKFENVLSFSFSHITSDVSSVIEVGWEAMLFNFRQSFPDFGLSYTFILPTYEINTCFKELNKKILMVLFKCLLGLTSVKYHFLK
jgi:hypothetical protein